MSSCLDLTAIIFILLVAVLTRCRKTVRPAHGCRIAYNEHKDELTRRPITFKTQVWQSSIIGLVIVISSSPFLRRFHLADGRAGLQVSLWVLQRRALVGIYSRYLFAVFRPFRLGTDECMNEYGQITDFTLRHTV